MLGNVYDITIIILLSPLTCLIIITSYLYYDIIISGYIISSIGVVFAFHSNEKVNDSIRDFDGIVNTAIDNVLGFVEDTQRVKIIYYMLHLVSLIGFRR